MRKMLMAVFALFFMAGLVVAVEVTVVKYDKDKKVLTYKEKDGEKELTATVTDKTKYNTTDQKGENPKEADYAAFEKRVTGKKGGAKLEITVKEEKLIDATWKTKGK